MREREARGRPAPPFAGSGPDARVNESPHQCFDGQTTFASHRPGRSSRRPSCSKRSRSASAHPTSSPTPASPSPTCSTATIPGWSSSSVPARSMTRAAALEYAERLQPLAVRYASELDRGDAQLFREAAHVDRLEGAHQRSRPRRELPHQQGAAAGAQAAARRQRSWSADGVGIPRHADSAAHRRPDVVGRDRGANDGKPDPPRAGVRAVDAGRLQEQHGREHADRGGRGPDGAFTRTGSRR